jgi:hypothetical protein
MAVMTVDEMQERADIALEATWEIDACIRLLRQELPTEAEHLALTGLARRIEDLTSVVMSVLGRDDERKTQELHKVVRG